VAASSIHLDYVRIAAIQWTCQETLKADSSTFLQLCHVDTQGQQVICDISTGQPRPLIPVPDRRDVFRAIHELACRHACHVAAYDSTGGLAWRVF
jgi:hypothetical protein